MELDEFLIQKRIEIESAQCPDLYRNIMEVQDALDVISGKWKLLILFAVIKGNRKFSDIQAFCKGISDKILDSKLKELIENKMIEKDASGYAMTLHGVSLYKVIIELWEWGKQHRVIMTQEKGAKK